MTNCRYNDILEIKDSSGQELLIFTMSTLNANTGESPATIGIISLMEEPAFAQKLLFGKWNHSTVLIANSGNKTISTRIC